MEKLDQEWVPQRSKQAMRAVGLSIVYPKFSTIATTLMPSSKFSPELEVSPAQFHGHMYIAFVD